MENNYKLTLSERQAHCIKSACETQSRLEFGQLGAITDALSGVLLHEDWQLLCEKVRELEGFISKLPRKNTLRSDYCEMSWDLYQVIRHRLAWDRAYKQGIIKQGDMRKWPEMITVDYDDPHHKSTEKLCLIGRA